MISVIIPVYNAERYLRRCAGSVLGSSYPDFELLLVDDGSTDGSLGICGDLARRDRRVRVFRQEHRGVSAARNRGLELCQGEWVVFVDADDFISPRFFAAIAEQSAKEPDIMLFEYTSRDREFRASGGPAELARGREALLDLAGRNLTLRQLRRGGRIGFRSACGKAFRKARIDQYGLRFPTELFYGEDLIFCMEYLLRAESYLYLPETAYFYDLHGDSSSRRFRLALLENHGRLLERLRRVLEEGNALPRLGREFDFYVLGLLTTALLRVVFHPENRMPFREKAALCDRIREDGFCGAALRQGLRCGSLRRRALMLAFRRRHYRLAALFCRLTRLSWLGTGEE